MKSNFTNTLIIFYILCAYVLLQFGWWSYELIQLHKKLIFSTPNQSNIVSKEQFLDKIYMVAGEGIVFLFLIIIGAAYILRTFKKEVQIARNQQNFLLSITHELKTPISTIKLYLQTLQKRKLDENKKNEAITTMLSENERLNSLVSKMLLAAKIDNANFMINKQPQNFSELIRSIVKNKWKNDKSISLSIKDDIFYLIDSESIETILSNLVDNAKKYGATKISIDLKKLNEGILLSVSDDGIGISDQEKEKVFERFYRAGNENVRKTKGTGLGLFIVKTLVKMNNATIKIIDNHPNGTTFVIRFKIQEK